MTGRWVLRAYVARYSWRWVNFNLADVSMTSKPVYRWTYD